MEGHDLLQQQASSSRRSSGHLSDSALGTNAGGGYESNYLFVVLVQSFVLVGNISRYKAVGGVKLIYVSHDSQRLVQI